MLKYRTKANPNGVSGDYVRSKVEAKGILKIVNYFLSSTMTTVKGRTRYVYALQLKAQPQEPILTDG